MDEITLSGSVSGIRIPPINKVHLVYAKHACQEFAKCAIEAESLDLDIKCSQRHLSRALSVPTLKFNAVVKDHGEIRSALKVSKTTKTKL